MRLRVIAVGTRMPAWVDAGFEEYRRRLSGSWRVTLQEIAPARRPAGSGAAPHAPSLAREASAILTALAPEESLVCLDERGTECSTLELARWLEQCRAAGRALAFVIGGPDGLASEVLERSQRRWSLSRLTLPHALARVVLIEQLYRASTVLAGHPYHRA